MRLLVMIIFASNFMGNIATVGEGIEDKDIPEEKVGEDASALVPSPVSSVAGHSASLSCDITPELPDDQLLLVLWYKIGISSPVYTFDVRDRPLSIARVYSDQTLFDEPTRAVMKVNHRPAALVISNLIPADEGLYKCRADFKKSPTKHFLMNLTVIAPPHPPTIYDGKGKRMTDRLGPYKLGTKLVATCVSNGGQPPPSLSWWRDTELIDDTYEEVNGQTINTLEMKNVTREDQETVMECRAKNNNISDPSTTVLRLHVAYPASSVRLSPSISPLLAGDLATFSCLAMNVSGPSIFRWFIGQTQLYDHTDHQGEKDKNTWQSTLRYSPSPSDDRQYLSCSTVNTLYPDLPKEDGYILDIKFTPIAKIKYWRSLVSSDIHLGDDVYFECEITANPTTYNVTWRHNGKRVDENVSNGVLIGNQTLVLQKIKLSDAGLYTCVASNVVADGESNAVMLDIKYPPKCVHMKSKVIWIPLGSTKTILCQVTANPAPNKFQWKLITSADVQPSEVKLDKSRFKSHNLESRLSYLVRTEQDYGRIICWAENGADGDPRPCTFIVAQPIRPGALANCTMLNQTWDSLHITCELGSNQHIDQEVLSEDAYKFVAIVTDKITNESKVSSFHKPEFYLLKLEPGSQYSIELYAENKKGAGPPITLMADTKKQAEKRTAESKIALESDAEENYDMEMTILGIITGITGVLSCIVTVVIVLVRQRLEQNRASSEGSGKYVSVEGKGSQRGSLGSSVGAEGLQCTAQLRSKGSEIDLDKINSEHQRRPRGAFKSESEDLSLQHGPINSNNSSHQRLLGSNIDMFMEPSPLYGSLDRYTSCDTHCSLSSVNRSLTLPRNSSNLSNSKQAKKKVPCGTMQDVPANTLVLSCEIFDIPTVGDLIDTPVDAFRVDPPTNFSDDAINRQESQEFDTAHQGSSRRLDCKNLLVTFSTPCQPEQVASDLVNATRL